MSNVAKCIAIGLAVILIALTSPVWGLLEYLYRRGRRYLMRRATHNGTDYELISDQLRGGAVCWLRASSGRHVFRATGEVNFLGCAPCDMPPRLFPWAPRTEVDPYP